jgi:hypothetical protein
MGNSTVENRGNRFEIMAILDVIQSIKVQVVQLADKKSSNFSSCTKKRESSDA